ncbi:MAG: hypothetical protein HKP58_00170 [Desulfatitalea sp.]|nr:MoaD/ThiS family protein [Desulfatitalea sp.]NNJ98804.1 hypothetical protein [Desulfatitalea sp.]
MDEDGCFSFDEGATVQHLYKALKIPLPLRFLINCYVNSQVAGLNQKLRDGDIVSVLGTIAGG